MNSKLFNDALKKKKNKVLYKINKKIKQCLHSQNYQYKQNLTRCYNKKNK